ncbi:hypothetical protein OsI_22751 [Oryza sativa Indica Group]|uniref:Uncharacterized protein n=1 Tax=Oryza sativa subsp. indica TaxID=39946 RepID=A2YCB5_ORYSI|nr:hypothetical protein OsI_22751 [Oryza sativa Indica Group]
MKESTHRRDSILAAYHDTGSKTDDANSYRRILSDPFHTAPIHFPIAPRSLTSRKGSRDEGQDMLLVGGRDGPQGVNDGLRLIVIQV